MIGGVDFVSVPTADLAAAVEFYREVLGLQCSVHLPERSYAEFETGNLTLSVIEPLKMGMQLRPNPNHIADVAAARTELERRGVTFGGAIFDTGVCHMGFFVDPDGNQLMLHHRCAHKAGDAGA